jgi:hypothetical protein
MKAEPMHVVQKGANQAETSDGGNWQHAPPTWAGQTRGNRRQ